MKQLRLATRTSPLALAQTDLVERWLTDRLPGVALQTVPIATTGDREKDWSLQKEGGKGLFTKELEEALLAGEADLAIHSAKDLPTEAPTGLSIAGFLPREQAHDVLIVRNGLARLRRIATGSPRRRIQLSRFFPKSKWVEIRGNVETRLRKVAEGESDATVLASAGLRRLGIHAWPGLVFVPLALEQCVPAPGQGAIAVQCRTESVERLAGLLDADTAHAVALERYFLERLGGGCQVAYAAHVRNQHLLVFHENCGYRSVPISGQSPDSGRGAVDGMIGELIT